MDTIGKRLTYLIESKGLNKAEFCEKFGFNYQAFVPITNDKRTLGIKIINDLMTVFPNLNINWLLYGSGSINASGKQIDLVEEPDEFYKTDIMEKVFLKYLDNNNVRNKVLEIVHDEKK